MEPIERQSITDVNWFYFDFNKWSNTQISVVVVSVVGLTLFLKFYRKQKLFRIERTEIWTWTTIWTSIWNGTWNWIKSRIGTGKANKETSEEKVQKNQPNLDFYLGQQPSRPDNVFISEFHSVWRSQYDTLESSHTFIQWLFPLRERGVNWEASPLTEEEVKMFCKSWEAQNNLLESYKMMLDFYGIELINEQTGDVTRAENWKERFYNLNSRSHNNLRITRIIKCLGILGFQHFQFPLVQFFLNEILVEGELPSVKDSALRFFLPSVRDVRQRQKLSEFVDSNKDCLMEWSDMESSSQ